MLCNVVVDILSVFCCWLLCWVCALLAVCAVHDIGGAKLRVIAV